MVRHLRKTTNISVGVLFACDGLRNAFAFKKIQKILLRPGQLIVFGNDE
jgi:hypothetical protein